MSETKTKKFDTAEARKRALKTMADIEQQRKEVKDGESYAETVERKVARPDVEKETPSLTGECVEVGQDPLAPASEPPRLVIRVSHADLAAFKKNLVYEKVRVTLVEKGGAE